MGVEQNGKTVVLTHSSGASAEVYLYGATVTSWKSDGKEHLFLSKTAKLDGSAAIRGGIPVVFPVFGPPPSSPPEYAALKQHGFARSEVWKVDKILLDNEDGVSVRFAPPPTPASFPHKFELFYVVTLAPHQLVCDVHVKNTGSEDFKFQALLHSYLAVPDATKVSITGIDAGVTYKDKILGGETGTAPGGALVVDRPLDRVYAKVPSKQIGLDDGAGSSLTVRFSGFEDCVVWNPREEGGRKMADMEEGGWDRYVCIEPGYVSEFKNLKPGELFIGQEALTAA